MSEVVQTVTLADNYGSVPKGIELRVLHEGGDYFRVNHRGRPVNIPKPMIIGQYPDKILAAWQRCRNNPKAEAKAPIKADTKAPRPRTTRRVTVK